LKTLSYGEKDYIDNKIASRIAEYLNLEHLNISFKDSLCPSKIEFEQQFKNGGEYFINCWFSVINKLKNNNYISNENSVILIGDVLDILRAKNIKSIRSRKNRIKLQINDFFGIKIKEKPINIKGLEESIITN